MAVHTKMINENLQRYLDIFYLTKNEVLHRLSIDSHTLNKAIKQGRMPSWSYRVKGNRIESKTFGSSEAKDCIDGEYYSPTVLSWYNRNSEFLAMHSDEEVYQFIKKDFLIGYKVIANCHVRFHHTFPDLMHNKDQLEVLAENTWSFHMNGSLGVSAQNPATINHIIEMQVSVSALNSFTKGGSKQHYTHSEVAELMDLIADYNSNVMPFSPADYESSSRKRLVDDVLARLK